MRNELRSISLHPVFRSVEYIMPMSVIKNKTIINSTAGDLRKALFIPCDMARNKKKVKAMTIATEFNRMGNGREKVTIIESAMAILKDHAL
jgi:hypothetical protein